MERRQREDDENKFEFFFVESFERLAVEGIKNFVFLENTNIKIYEPFTITSNRYSVMEIAFQKFI